VCLERRACRGDVHDQLRRAGSRRALRRAEALDDAIARDAVGLEVAARDVHVLRRNAHMATVIATEIPTDSFEIVHDAHVDPGCRYRNDDIGLPEVELAHDL